MSIQCRKGTQLTNLWNKILMDFTIRQSRAPDGENHAQQRHLGKITSSRRISVSLPVFNEAQGAGHALLCPPYTGNSKEIRPSGLPPIPCLLRLMTVLKCRKWPIWLCHSDQKRWQRSTQWKPMFPGIIAKSSSPTKQRHSDLGPSTGPRLVPMSATLQIPHPPLFLVTRSSLPTLGHLLYSCL